MKRNTDEALRRLERAHLASLEDRAALGAYAAALARMGSAEVAARSLCDLWDREEIDEDDEDLDAVAEALAGTHGVEAAVEAVNTIALERELERVHEDDRDQDQRDPLWRGQRFHSIGFDFSRPRAGGSFYAPYRAALVTVSEASVGGVDGLLVTVTQAPVADLEHDLSGEITVWATPGRRLSAWALRKTLDAARRMVDMEPAGRTDMTLICAQNDLVSRTERRGRKTVKIDPLQDVVDSLLPGAKRVRGTADNDFRWRSKNASLEIMGVANRHEINDLFTSFMASRFQITPFPYSVLLSELNAEYYEERGDESLTLRHVPTDEIVAYWGGHEDDGEEETGRTVVGSLVDDGFLDPADWTTSAANYAHEGGLVRVEDFVQRRPAQAARATQPSEDEVRAVAIPMARSLFEAMSDPAMRGPRMTWARLPDMAAERAEAEGGMYFDDVSQDTLELMARIVREEMLRLQAENPRAWERRRSSR